MLRIFLMIWILMIFVLVALKPHGWLVEEEERALVV